MNYHKKVLDHYHNPRNVGTLDPNSSQVGTGMVGSPACGDVIKLQILVDEDGKIKDVKFKAFGCGAAIASSSWVTEWLKGKTLTQAQSIDNAVIANDLALPPIKAHCSVLAKQALFAAIKDYEKKKNNPL